MHYFSPVEKMPLLEIITHVRHRPVGRSPPASTGKEAGEDGDRRPDGPGFYTRASSPRT
jgi:3-hydroxyacyl-CoA dehydrogenase/enoyl-CoA hydratase/3-hydroxybutyryl-CoA epimerase